MKVLRFARIGADRTVNIDLITHIWSLRGSDGQQQIKIHSLGHRRVSAHEASNNFEYDDAKKLRDQLVGGWHDHKFAQLGPTLSVNPAQITGFQIYADRICMVFANDYTICRSENDSGYSESMKLHAELLSGTCDGGANPS